MTQRLAECVRVDAYSSSHIFDGCVFGDHDISYAFCRYIGRLHNSAKGLGVSANFRLRHYRERELLPDGRIMV